MSDIPAAIRELREIDQWVAYTRSKVPVSPRGMPASSTDPKTWGSLGEAKFIRRVQSLPGVGFVLTEGDPYVGVDLDGAIDPVTGFLCPWAQEIVERLDSYTELSPSGLGVHIWVKGEIPRRSYVVDDGRKIEVYASARYFTVTGRPLPGTRQDIVERDLLPFVEDYCGAAVAPVVTPSGDWDGDDVERWLADALRCIDPDSYHQWVKVGMAIKSALGDAGWQWWDHWSSGSAKYPGPEETVKKWKTFDAAGAVGIGTVVWLAERGGFELPSPHGDIPESLQHGWDEWLDRQAGVADPEGMDEGLDIVIYDASELYFDDSPPEPDLIGPGVLSAGDFGLIFGPPKSMKSMICMDMFRQFALGRSWCGWTVDRPIRTLYLQFEIKRDRMRQRLQLAPMTREEAELMGENLKITKRFTPTLSAEFVAELAEQTLARFGGPPDVLVVDPLANIFTGESENDNAQMSRFVRQLKIMRNAISPEVALFLVHHANKRDRAERSAEPFGSIRGASALRGAYDAGIYVDKRADEKGLVSVWTELRNGPGREPFELRFDQGRFSVAQKDEGEAAEEVDEALEVDEADVVRALILDEAREARFYTASTFTDRFAGRFGLPAVSGLKALLRSMQNRQLLRMFRRVQGLDVPELHHRSHGYLCVPQMAIVKAGERYPVRPEYAMDPRTGSVIELDT